MTTLLERIKGASPDDTTGVEFDDDFPADIRAEIAPDPEPGSKPAKSRPARRTAAPAGRPVSAAVRRRVADELEAYTKLVALGISVRDSHCGPVLNDQSRAIAEALADIIARNPNLVRWVETSGVLGDWLKLGTALLPVANAFRHHHITKTVSDDEGAAGVDASVYGPYRG